MPLYEYRCDDCGDFEAWRRMAELEMPLHCPSCDAIARRIFSPPSVNLNSGSLRDRRGEPRLVEAQREPTTPRYQSPSSGRPWMISHAPPRY
jgi:putative FmdB family regulatory protein